VGAAATRTSSAKGVPRIDAPSSPAARASSIARARAVDRLGHVLDEVEPGVGGAGRVGAQRDPFEHLVRILRDEEAVLAAARLVLSAVGDDVTGRRLGSGRELPFAPGGESGAAAPAQPRLRDLRDDVAGVREVSAVRSAS
jgi:hypothetical protein